MRSAYMLVLALAFSLAASQGVAKEPPHIKSMMGQIQLQGLGRLNFWGFHVYDANLYRGATKDSQEFALELRYQKSFSGEAIANRTVDEMKNLGIAEAQATSWGKELANTFPNVEPGQTITAIYIPKQGTSFFYEGKKISQIQSADFAKAFFGIWLDSKTSVPKLRADLLGQGCPPPLISGVC
ncbi:chalcone isomerase family protein [Polynucleobacter sp. AM-25C3]|uniref:chalcone isomerase family protein n=1 Tax=Polynucleobacter sp. AM-25C3 TaxID=1855569 RepID=UPI001C0BF4D8|nr:chalcone isomerase family protein [Polynucleobacter sp. AM-25C3]MBU3602737.1 chalcone isomerase family protein [Polynucleobacter sp. AM-25C3]